MARDAVNVGDRNIGGADVYEDSGSRDAVLILRHCFLALCLVLLGMVFYYAWLLDAARSRGDLATFTAEQTATGESAYSHRAAALTAGTLLLGVFLFRQRTVRRRHRNSRREVSELEFRALHSHAILEQLHVGVVVTDRNDNILSVNSAGLQILAPFEPVKGRKFGELLGADWRRHSGYLQCVTEGHATENLHYDAGIYRLNDPRESVTAWIQVSLSAFVVHRRLRFLFTFRDVTEFEKIRESQQISHEVVQHIAEGVLITNFDAVIQFVNPAFTEITGYAPREAIGKTPKMLQSGVHDQEFYKAMWDELLSSGRWSGEIWNRRKSGDIYPEQLGINALRDSAGRTSGYVAIFFDITQRKRKEQDLHRLAEYDFLTGLSNRRSLMRYLDTTTRLHVHGDPGLAVLFIDLDGFKPINDCLGHAAGDLVLREVAARIGSCTRRFDRAARIGGDEFVIAVRGIESDGDAARFADRLLDLLSRPYLLGEEEVVVTASVGIAVFPRGGDDPEKLLRAADTAMYEAKRTGKNRYHISDSTPNVRRA